MPDTKITALTAIGANPIIPATFPIPMVDLTDTSMAASGTTKKVTVNQILGAGGTATLASATITGDLTVDTSTLKVDSANNRVGIVQATPLYPLHLVGEFGLEEASPAGTGSKLRFIGDATKYNFRIGKQLNVSNGFEITPSTTLGGATFSNPVYTVTNDGIHTFLDGAGGTRMTLNATGLGVGTTSPLVKINGQGTAGDPASSGTTQTGAMLRASNTSTGAIVDIGVSNTGSRYGWIQATNSGDLSLNYDLVINKNGGNVGIGVTPNTWTIYKALQVQGASIFSTTGNDTGFGSNVYYDGGYKFRSASSDKATRYEQFGGSHSWHYTAAAGTAGNTATFTQAMTLDASGRLLVGTPSSGNSAGDGIVKLGVYGHCISQTGVSIASGSSVDFTIVTTGAGYQGFLSVANTQDANANIRTQTTYSVFGRGTSSTFTQIATANGSIAGASFTVTTPSNGLIRITNTSGAAATISAQFFGGASA